MVTNKMQKSTNDITDWYAREGKRKKKDDLDEYLRWEHDVNSVAGTTWQRIAKDRKLWKETYVLRHTEANKTVTDLRACTTVKIIHKF